ncbi:hypothetical protein [Pseudomonas lopnurensis]|uniref:hypothetical protein n=1 Tax=Pseudomonas lopnurensis TaxID=1477517 RepID=UPI0028ADCA36|nr:hypothetical protein [Pseudomonas lopnurensis]
MKSWLTRYLTKTSILAVLVTTSLVALLIAALIQWIGSALIGLTEFSQLVERAKGWLFPLRLAAYSIAIRYWWTYRRLCIARSSSPDNERRAWNRMTVACTAYLAALEYSCWAPTVEGQLP